MGARTGAYRVLVEKPEEGRQLGRARCRWDDNIKMDLKWISEKWNGGHGLDQTGSG
jgi:hypothetical protein